MRTRTLLLVIPLTVVGSAMVLFLCGPTCCSIADKAFTKYRRGVWVEVELTEPIRFNEPVPVTITVETRDDEPDLRIGMDVSSSVLIEGEYRWTVEARANQPVQVTSTVRFTHEGWYDVIAGAFTRSGHASSGAHVHITRAGGTVNPQAPPAETPGTLEYRTPPPVLMPTRTLIPKPTP